MQVSADCRLTPRPPALVLRMKIKRLEPGALNRLMSIMRFTRDVLPSSRTYLASHSFSHQSKTKRRRALNTVLDMHRHVCPASQQSSDKEPAFQDDRLA